MKVRHAATYGASPTAVRAMLLDPAFREEVCTAQGALDHEVTVTEASDVSTVGITRTQSMAGAPAAAVKLVGSTVRIDQRETWTGPGDAELVIAIPGRPGELRGAITLRPTPTGGCEQVVTGDVTVAIPLVGGKLEKLIADVLVRGLQREAQVGAAWLADHG